MRSLVTALLFLLVLPAWKSVPPAIPTQVRLAQASPAVPAQATDPVAITEMGVERKDGKIRVTLEYRSDRKIKQFIVVGAVTIGGKDILLINAKPTVTIVAVNATGKVVTWMHGYTLRDSENTGVLEFSFHSKAFGVYNLSGKKGGLRMRLFEATGSEALATATRTGITF